MPNIYKIGYTDRSPMQRVFELSNSTSCPLPFDLVCYMEIYDAQQAELNLHIEFQENRLSPDREFFDFELPFLFENVMPLFKERGENFTSCLKFYDLESKWITFNYEPLP